MRNYDKLLFVCKSNTAVSPMAEAIMQQMFRLEDILIASKGLVVLFPEPINPKAEAILVSHGLSMKDHTSAPFVKDDFDERTLVLALSQSQKESLEEEYPSAMLNLYTLPEYIGSDEQVMDPYGGTLADYGACYEQLARMLAVLADQLKREDTMMKSQTS